ncbi:hypothetical protein Poli38472_005257 [Pythium oligandrum]|uniref:Uncharacterized protein n=1 Tax=Pythium oligandrum TaxID=41045 RepID=A0A8K1FJ13_PYTOL|nr:hypothetical protein Poli38472_005257 [Pythium oligandrum]|eukprot:TMW62639.1 hypothetical protein Poli38472_005257 [Pythium oligandrum]
MSMWDPNALGAWQHDDDLVSWRSLDTIRGIDVDPFNADTLSDEGHCDTISEASDGLPEVIEQNSKKEPVVATLGESESERPGRDRAYQELEQRYTELEERERRLQDEATKQMHQLEQLTDEIHQKEVQVRTLQGEQFSWKDKASQLERQVTQLQTALREKELTVDQNTQIMQQKNTELGALEKKIQSLQTANESYQDQARKAIEEKDKVHKDYLQVVYELGKIQKQMNATAKETVSIAEKDFLLREIDQLRREKDQLVEKLKDTESKRMSAVQSSSVAESQRVRELQNRVRDLEDELRVLRSNKTSGSQPTLHHSSSLPPPAPSFAASNGPSTARGMNPMDYSPSYSFESAVEYGGSRAGNSSMDSYAMPSLLQGVGTSQQSKPKTLKDMLQEKQNDRAPTQQLWQSTDSGIPSLASLGYSSLNRFDATSQPKSLLNMYGSYDEVSRASSSVSTIGDLLRHQATGIQSSPFSDNMNTIPVDPTISAPFATEKQTFLQDAMQKRDLEQKLLKLHVDKEQTEAKLTKVEHAGLKTMSARTEKAWLESRVRELTTEISRIKLSLR